MSASVRLLTPRTERMRASSASGVSENDRPGTSASAGTLKSSRRASGPCPIRAPRRRFAAYATAAAADARERLFIVRRPLRKLLDRDPPVRPGKEGAQSASKFLPGWTDAQPGERVAQARGADEAIPVGIDVGKGDAENRAGLQCP